MRKAEHEVVYMCNDKLVKVNRRLHGQGCIEMTGRKCEALSRIVSRTYESVLYFCASAGAESSHFNRDENNLRYPGTSYRP
jgi:hypothetical protein